MAEPLQVWAQLTPDDQGRFLLVAARALAHAPMADPGWPGLTAQNLIAVAQGHLTLTPQGIHLMLSLLETEFAWFTEVM